MANAAPRRERRQEEVPRAPRLFRERLNPLEIFRADQVRRKYRFWPGQIENLLELVREDIEPLTDRSHAISATMKICAALRFYACGTYHDVVGDVLGLSETSAWVAVQQVNDSLLRQLPRFISWPQTVPEKQRMKAGFSAIAGFPGVLGAIDCTHVKIKAPAVHENAYVNRHGYHSLNVQMTCDHQGVITNVVARWPGGTHDAHIFATSGLGRHMQSVPLDGHLIGDSGYALRPYLLTPVTNPQTPAEERYARSHQATRVRIEQTFGRLKNRFGGLHDGLRCSVERAVKVVTVCAMLHNYAMLQNDIGEDFAQNEPVDGLHNNEIQEHLPVNNHAAGVARRNHIVDNFFN